MAWRQGVQTGNGFPCKTDFVSIYLWYTMVQHLKFYIDGSWVEPSQAKTRTVINPAN